jgi:O-antigen/teichoic acid export membrane protein
MQANTERIAKNTLMLYFRQILIMLVSLYTVRVVLNTLGAEDYGIYNVAAGVVTMFGFLSNSMATATQRYLSFELGQGDFEQLKKVFNLSITIYVLIGIMILFLAETFGLWFVNHKLVIPENRMAAARWIYQFAILSFMFTMITAPYMASVIAHENMQVYAYVSIVEVFLKLVIVYCLRLFPVDKLMLYGVLMFAVTFINTGIYRFICTKKYDECRFRFYWNYALFKELTSYVGWNLFGTVSWMVKNQGINILLNIFFGPIVNAARAVAMQVSTAVNNFAQNFITAVRPQIVKSYASGNKEQMLRLVFLTTRAAFFLLLFFIVPLQLELALVLKLWLKDVPEYVVAFTRILLINTFIDSMGSPLASALHATGKVKSFQVISGIIFIGNLPVSLVVLLLGFSAVSVQVIGVILSVIVFLVRLFVLARQIQFSIWYYIKSTLIPSITVCIIGSIIPVIFVWIYPEGVKRLFLTVITSTVSIMLTIFFLGISSPERLIVITKVKSHIPFYKNKG